MASLIPALSEKAKLEIVRSCLHPRDWGYSDEVEIYFDKAINCISQAFQDLFDLEKYPITNDMIVSYLENHPKARGGRYSEPFQDAYSFCHESYPLADYDPLCCVIFNADLEMGILEQLLIIKEWFDIDLFTLIGDIHGWWEKPQTY